MTLVRHPRVDSAEVEFAAVRSQGAGGQNVNKVSSAAHLRFDVRVSSLPEDVKQRLLALQDHRLTAEGVVVIKAQEHRSLAMNREAALARLQALVDQVAHPPHPCLGAAPHRGQGAKGRSEGDAGAGRGRLTGLVFAAPPRQPRRRARLGGRPCGPAWRLRVHRFCPCAYGVWPGRGLGEVTFSLDPGAT